MITFVKNVLELLNPFSWFRRRDEKPTETYPERLDGGEQSAVNIDECHLDAQPAQQTSTAAEYDNDGSVDISDGSGDAFRTAKEELSPNTSADGALDETMVISQETALPAPSTNMATSELGSSFIIGAASLRSEANGFLESHPFVQTRTREAASTRTASERQSTSAVSNVLEVEEKPATLVCREQMTAVNPQRRFMRPIYGDPMGYMYADMPGINSSIFIGEQAMREQDPRTIAALISDWTHSPHGDLPMPSQLYRPATSEPVPVISTASTQSMPTLDVGESLWDDETGAAHAAEAPAENMFRGIEVKSEIMWNRTDANPMEMGAAAEGGDVAMAPVAEGGDVPVVAPVRRHSLRLQEKKERGDMSRSRSLDLSMGENLEDVMNEKTPVRDRKRKCVDKETSKKKSKNGVSTHIANAARKTSTQSARPAAGRINVRKNLASTPISSASADSLDLESYIGMDDTF